MKIFHAGTPSTREYPKMMKTDIFGAGIGLLAIVMLPMSVSHAYEAGDWLVRGKIINVNPNDSSGTISINGIDQGTEGVSVEDDTVPALDITYMLTPHWGVEAIVGFTQHTVNGTDSWAFLGPVAETKVLPPTLTLQYHFAPDSQIKPYLGLGINYTKFFDEKIPSSSLLSNPGDSVELDDSWGLALQAGLDYALNKDWFINVDLKYIDIDTTARYRNTSAGSVKVSTEIDPIIFGIGIGRRF
jgi:outer membrane protein